MSSTEPPENETQPESPSKTIQTQVARRHDRSRTVALGIAYLLPLLLAWVHQFVIYRLPFGGEFFKASSLYSAWWSWVIWPGAIGTVVAWFVGWVKGRSYAPLGFTPHAVSLTEGELLLQHKEEEPEAIRLADIATSTLLPDKNRLLLRRVNGEQICLHMPEPEDANWLFQQLEQRPRQTIVGIPLGSRASARLTTHVLAHVGLFVGWLVTLGLLVVSDGELSKILHYIVEDKWFLLAIAAFPVSAWYLSRRVIEIGNDGLTIIGGKGSRSKEHIPFAAIRHFRETFDRRIAIGMQDGRRIKIPNETSSVGLFREMSRALKHYRSAERATTNLPSELQRQDRSTEAWRQALTKAQSSGDYRASAIAPEELEAVLHNPANPPQERIGAALMLSKKEGARENLRIAVEQTADPALRAALEAAAEGEIAEAELTRAQKRR